MVKKLYYWQSQVLRDYAPGYLIAMGDNVEDAKRGLREAYAGANPAYLEALLREMDGEPTKVMSGRGAMAIGGSA